MKGKRNRGFLNARRRCRPPNLNSSARSSCHLSALERLRSSIHRLMWKPLALRGPTAPARVAGEYESNRGSESCVQTQRLAHACTRRSSNRDCTTAEGNLPGSMKDVVHHLWDLYGSSPKSTSTKNGTDSMRCKYVFIAESAYSSYKT